MDIINDELRIKPYSLKELAAIYEVTPHTMRAWLLPHKEAIGERVGRYYTISQVRIIFEKLGLPGKITG